MKRTTKLILVINAGLIVTHLALSATYYMVGAPFRGTLHAILTVLFILLFAAYWSVRDQIDRWS